MIRYSLRCAAGHNFESWFRDSAAFDQLAASNSLACAICGNSDVEKAIMAPALTGSERASPAWEQSEPAAKDKAASAGIPNPDPQGAEQPQLLSGTAGRVEQALTELRRYLAANADYVGRGFADEARRIHLGESDERAIWGEASPDEAKALSEEGIPVAPLPFLSRRDD
ncbi:MAG TPA: DUF1178 family protein [Paracoccaceae bacterium]|nr:DUF1178 family protein [Paracoccaceae bacterium]